MQGVLPFNAPQLAFHREMGQKRKKDRRLPRGDARWKRHLVTNHLSLEGLFKSPLEEPGEISAWPPALSLI